MEVSSSRVPGSEIVTCAFCGHKYDQGESRSACRSCPLHPKGQECGWLRCPNCGYEMPRESGVFKALRSILGGGVNRKASQAPCPEDKAHGHAHPLAELPVGYQGRVALLATKDQRKLQKLMAFGILPGMPVRVLQTNPSIVFQVGQTQLAVDEGIAVDILVGKD